MSTHTRLLNKPDQHSSYPLELFSFNRLDPDRYPYLLASSADRENNTHFDILPACPQYQLRLNADDSLDCDDPSCVPGDGFFNTLESLYQRDRTAVCESTVTDAPVDLPFTGGWFVYLCYEMAAEIEPCLQLPELPAGEPKAIASRCPAAIIYDKQNDRLYATAESGYEYLLDELEQDYLKLQSATDTVREKNSIDTEQQSIRIMSLHEADPEPYLQQVDAIQQYIIDGDIFQANLSRLWQATLKEAVDDSAIYACLSRQNPSSFAALACLGGITVISSSPERLVSVRDGIVETRPIAGTRARGHGLADTELADELMSHPKEQAEHIMLIDLERNDLGRVCWPGSIEVNELMVLESWQHVHHIVSNIRGELRNDKSPVDVLRAVFPGGTITGCPKVHCIEILAEMEQQARGAYTGSLGYINHDGSMDFNILIRTLVRDHTGTGREIRFRAGGGIVSDSNAQRELEETRAKAKGLLKIFSEE